MLNLLLTMVLNFAYATPYESFAPYCGAYPSKEDCDDGDMTLFSGLLCLSGDSRGCAGVRDAQGSDGRWWRSPRRNPGNLGKENSFSRDMSLGVLAYLLATKDHAAGSNWINWIEKNRPCVLHFWGKCYVRGITRFCRDDDDYRCTITPEMWKIIGEVWQHNGWPKNHQMADSKNVPDIPITDGLKGYELHLKAVKAFLRKKMGKGIGTTPDELLAQEPWNTFFLYLKHGKSDIVRESLSKVCPTSAPNVRKSWTWERRAKKWPWDRSMGWECIFIDNLLK